jgi:hypothetical protein
MKHFALEWEDTLLRFGPMGEKTDWTYLPVAAQMAEKLFPGRRTSFKVCGLLDGIRVEQLALIPIGDGNFIIPVEAQLRRQLGKAAGALVKVSLSVDTSEYVMNGLLTECLDDDLPAKAYFQTLAPSHQRYFSKWIDAAKIDATRPHGLRPSLTPCTGNNHTAK